MTGRLPHGGHLKRLIVLELNEQGSLVDQNGRAVPAEQVSYFLHRSMEIPTDVTDIFVWVHGWRNDRARALSAATRLFHGMEGLHAVQSYRYPRLRTFKGAYVVVCWPAQSSPLPWGYARIRNRAHAMTDQGYAEYVLASLLGYLDEERRKPPTVPGVLQTSGGQYLHCVGHSFGGRFIAQAVAAAARPSPPTLPLLPKNDRFRFTVDNLLVFQMAAKPDIFNGRLRALLGDAPLQGPLCLTFSRADRATCLWHRLAEGRRGIGCVGADSSAAHVTTTRLRPVAEDYITTELTARIVNIDASWRYRRRSLLAPEGSHSDLWYEESAHLLLTLVNLAR